MKKLKEEKLMSSEFYLRGFEAGKQKMIEEFKEVVEDNFEDIDDKYILLIKRNIIKDLEELKSQVEKGK